MPDAQLLRKSGSRLGRRQDSSGNSAPDFGSQVTRVESNLVAFSGLHESSCYMNPLLQKSNGLEIVTQAP